MRCEQNLCFWLEHFSCKRDGTMDLGSIAANANLLPKILSKRPRHLSVKKPLGKIKPLLSQTTEKAM